MCDRDCVISIVFTVAIKMTEEWKSDPEFAQYMTDLTSYSIEKLRKDLGVQGTCISYFRHGNGGHLERRVPVNFSSQARWLSSLYQ